MEAAQLLKQTRRVTNCFILIAAFLVSTGCVNYVRIDGPYEGKVIDAKTGQPIEGAVVFGEWSKAHPGAGGASHTYYDSREVLTDGNGEFSIPGLGLLVLTMIEEMDVIIFKAGYEQITPNPWSGLKNVWPKDKVIWQGDKATFRLKRLSMKERRKRHVSFPSCAVEHRGKMRNLIRESNIEMREMGMAANMLLPEE